MDKQKEMKIKLQTFVEELDLIEDKLSKWMNPTNIFSILKLTRNEIRHSNFLAFLFNPKESHGYEDDFFKDFLKTSVKDSEEQQPNLSYFDVALSDYNDVFIYREKANIDLLLVSEKNKLVVCIENKIGAFESKHQLKKYKNYVEANYKGYSHLFVFLTPDGADPSDNNWKIVSYFDIYQIIERRQKLKQTETKVDILITDYLDILRRDVLMDEELQKICQRIYFEHKDALDLIFDNRPDNLSLMSEIYIEALKELHTEGKIIFDPTFSGKSIIRFGLRELDEEFPTIAYSGGWNNHRAYAIEINNKNEQSSGKINLVFTGEIEEERRVDLEKFLRQVDSKALRTNWKWKSIGGWKIKAVNKLFMEDLSLELEEEDRDNLVKKLKTSLEDTLEKISSDVKKYIEIKNKLL